MKNVNVDITSTNLIENLKKNNFRFVGYYKIQSVQVNTKLKHKKQALLL